MYVTKIEGRASWVHANTMQMAQCLPLNEGPKTCSDFSKSLKLFRTQHIIQGRGGGWNELRTRGGMLTLDILLFPRLQRLGEGLRERRGGEIEGYSLEEL